MYENIIIPDELKEATIRYKAENYCILEDISNKTYIIFDISNDWKYMCVPFGYMLSTTINCFLDASENSIYHNDLEKIVQKNTIDMMLECKPMLNSLLQIITSIDNNKNYPDKEALKCAYIREWKKYRYISCVSVYSEYACYFSEKENENNDYELELKELSEKLHKIVSENEFIPYDIVYAQCDDGWFHGMVWFASITEHLFSRELYHLFVDNEIETPRICPRCGHFYYSNNNKAKYCNDCKNNYSDIRKEYRKKNETRYIHKRINDKLHASKRYDDKELDKFMIESNYYWDIVRGNEPKTQKESWYKDISTEKQYKEWLESKLKEYSAKK